MFAGLPSLSHEQQQKAVERIHELMAQGISSGQAIALVAEELRATHTGEQIVARFEDDTAGSSASLPPCSAPGRDQPPPTRPRLYSSPQSRFYRRGRWWRQEYATCRCPVFPAPRQSAPGYWRSARKRRHRDLPARRCSTGSGCGSPRLTNGLRHQYA